MRFGDLSQDCGIRDDVRWRFVILICLALAVSMVRSFILRGFTSFFTSVEFINIKCDVGYQTKKKRSFRQDPKYGESRKEDQRESLSKQSDQRDKENLSDYM